MRHLFLITPLLAVLIVGCGNNSKKNTSDLNAMSEVAEYCSSGFLDELNSAEISLDLYKKNGVIFGKELTEAHEEYQVIIKKYTKISCKATNHDTGEVKTISTEMVNGWSKDIFNLLYNAHFYKCKDTSRMAAYDKKGCAAIGKYMKTNFGYN